MMEFIDLAAQQQRIKSEIDANIQKVLTHGKYILGPEVAELEEKLAAYTGAKYCITCANGTDALQIALMALGIGPGDEGHACAYPESIQQHCMQRHVACPVVAKE